MHIDFSQTTRQFEEVKRATIAALTGIFPVVGKLHSLVLEKAWIDDNADATDYKSQLKAKNSENTWGIPVYAHLKLLDKDGTTIDEGTKIKIMTLPKPTQRHSFIVGGNEYQVHNQLRLKPGVYTIRKQNGELKTQVNLSKGKNFDLNFDENKGLFTINDIGKGQSNVGLYPILLHMGITPTDIAKAWGDKLMHTNATLADPHAVEKLENALGLKAGQTLQSYFNQTKIDPITTKAALGHSYDKVDGLLLLSASKNLLGVHLGKEDPTDRDSLEYKELHGIDDFIKERLEKNKQTLTYRIKRNIDNPKRIKISQLINTGVFSSTIDNFFLQDDKSETPEQTNPLEMLTGTQKVTIMGAGGIGSTHAITPEMRQIHPSHLGFIDPVHTPSSDKIGANLHLPLGAVKDGMQLKTRVIDKKGKEFFLDPVEMKNKRIGFPDEKGSTVKILYKGQVSEVPRSQVDYFIPESSDLFSYSTNLIPFLPSAQGNRAEMAAKMMEQAISLKHREAPLVQSLNPDKNETFEKTVGNYASVHSPAEGTVKKITDDTITLSTMGGDVTINLYNNFALNRKSFIHNYPRVKVGDRIKKDQLLADSNYSQNGVLALGTNMKTAYLAYKGLNFDDGVVISNSGADKLTSEHIYKKEVTIYPNIITGLEAFKSFYPTTISPDNLRKLDKDGIIKKGEKVSPGDVIIAALQKRTVSTEVGLLSKMLSERPKNVSIDWTLEDTGIVLDVMKNDKKIVVTIKTEEAAKIGDKVSNRHGGKGVITKIIPDNDMPRTADGKPVDVLLSPMGIVSRINVSQTYESALGKAAEKAGKPYVVNNFDGSDNLKVVKEALKKAGVDDKEELFDGETGKSLGQVHVGMPHILKLAKQTQANYSVRQGGPGYGYDANLQPLKAGGEEGSKSVDVLTMYSMLSHGARENLREMSAVKNTKNDEYWKALKAGELLPPPQPSFAYQKFLGYLKGSGVDVVKNGTQMTLAPFTDEQVRKASNGEITKPIFYRAKDMTPLRGGFFDPVKLGGFKGTNWGHLELAEPVVNPPFEKAVRKLTGLGKKFDEIMAGKMHLTKDGELNKEGHGVTGGAAIEQLLKGINVDKEIDALSKKAKTTKASQLDGINKQLRYLTALKKLNLRPEEAYIRNAVPIVPPQFRPVYPLPDGNITTADSNILYQNTGVLNTMMKLPVMDLLEDSAKADIRKDLYAHVKALSGITDLNIKGKQRSGFISEIKGGEGGQPKEGFFISKLLSKKQDYVGRGTIIPEPSLGIDEMAMPEPMAWKLFEPFVVRELKNHGKTPIRAMEEIKLKTSLAKKALDIVMNNRHVLLNRAPSLHKFSIMAFKPQITEGKSIKIPSLINKGFGADFDGDEQVTSILTFIPNNGISLFETKFMSQIEGKDMAARFKESIGGIDTDGNFYIVNLEDFPHSELIGTRDDERGKIDFYKVPEGIKVLSYDSESKKVLWKNVFGWSKHYQKEIEIVTLKSGRQIFTDDDPRAVYGIAKGELEPKRFTPTEATAQKVLVPLVIRTEEAIYGSSTKYGKIKLTPAFGHIIGAMISNGWVETNNGFFTGRCFIACLNEELGEYFLKIAKEIFNFKGKDLKYVTEEGGSNAYGASKKWGFLDDGAAGIISELIDFGARNKHLPPFFLNANAKFRNGLFAGLMDHDGTICVSHAKNKKAQLMANYSTASIRLAQELQWLAKSLGIRSRITTSKTPAGLPFWYVSFSNSDIQKWGGLDMINTEKLKALSNPEIKDELGLSPTAARNDLVPIHRDTAEILRKNMGCSSRDTRDHRTMYSLIHTSKETGYISRNTAAKILKEFPAKWLKDIPYLKEWTDIVNNTDVTWDQVESFEKTGIKEDGYDLTVPGYETFANIEGVILSNTMSLHIPISDEANAEADKMLPSKNLFQPGSGNLMVVPSQEAQLGLYYLSQTDDGRKLLNTILGPDFQVTTILDKKSTAKLLQDVAHAAPQLYGGIVKKLKQAGESYVYNTGFTVGVNDVADYAKESKKVAIGAQKLMNASGDLSHTNDIIQKQVDAFLKSKLEGKHNPFYDQIASGAKGSPSQLRSILISPLFVADAKGKVLPTPIGHSYASGLSTGDYWMASYGVRKGMMDTAIQTSLPGAFSKDVMATVIDNVISVNDCGTKDGIVLPVASNDALERFLAGDQSGMMHNTLVDTRVVNELKKKGVETLKVRSPLKCKAARGTCAHCYGLDEHGHIPEIGENIGAKVGQTISEPLTQLIMNSKHTGGVAGTGAQVGGYQRISQLLSLPAKLAGAASLAPVDGKVTKIVKGIAGGYDVYLGDKKVHVPQGRKPIVAIGTTVERGDALSDGPIKPQDLTALKNVEATQDYLTHELQQTYKDQGIGINRKTFETAVRSLTNTTQVLNQPKHSDYLPGDIIPYTIAQAYNSNLSMEVPVEDSVDEKLAENYSLFRAGHTMTEKDAHALKASGISTVKIQKEALEHKPFVKGMSSIPLLKQDWMAALGYRNLSKVITEGASQGWKTDTENYNPIPAIAHGATFGRGKEGKY